MEKTWQEKAAEGFKKYMEGVEKELGERSSLEEIERSMKAHERELMSTTMEALAKAKVPPPRGK